MLSHAKLRYKQEKKQEHERIFPFYFDSTKKSLSYRYIKHQWLSVQIQHTHQNTKTKPSCSIKS